VLVFLFFLFVYFQVCYISFKPWFTFILLVEFASFFFNLCSTRI
jgi:hypothetical protein